MSIQQITDLLNQNTADTLTLAKNIAEPVPLHKVEQGWSGIQILEHLLLTDKLIMTLIFSEPQGIADNQFIIGNDTLKKTMVEAPSLIEAPRAIHPTGGISTISQFITEYSSARSSLEAAIKNSTNLPENRYYRNRIFGNMTFSDWLLFIIYHTMRHHKQITSLSRSTQS